MGPYMPIWAPTRTGPLYFYVFFVICGISRYSVQHSIAIMSGPDGVRMFVGRRSLSGLAPGPGWGPYGPICALMGPYMGPYGPIWALMGPIWVLLDRSGHDQIRTFGPISHVSGPEMVFRRNDIMILHHFCWRSSKIKLC